MKAFFLCFCFFSTYSAVFGQNDLRIIAQKNNQQKVFEAHERVKLKFNYKGSTEIVVGRIDAVFTDSIYVRGLRKRTSNRVAAIAIKDIEKIKNIYTGARTTTGILSTLGASTSTFMLADILSKEPAFFPNISAGTAIGLFAVGMLPYIIVTLIEPSYSQNKGYEFKSVSYKAAPVNQ